MPGGCPLEHMCRHEVCCERMFACLVSVATCLTSGPTSTCQVCLVLALALLLTGQLQDLGSGSLDLRGTSGGRGTQSLRFQVCLGEGMSLYGGPGGLTPLSSAMLPHRTPGERRSGCPAP